MSEFLNTMKKRRSQYGLNKEVELSDIQIEELIRSATLHTPSAFNMQSSRVVVLYNEHHNTLWDIVKEELRLIVPADKFQGTSDRIDSYKAAYATILFFEDESVSRGFANKFPDFKDNFSLWGQQSNGMLQFAIWNLLSEADLGATLQHYNPLIDKKVASTWNIPADWKLVAQMPFGHIIGDVKDKTFIEIDELMKIYR